eukprot:TRINITY_DN4320_c0_g1_i1.p1 TRINITY_DN4320_c0_g1~~TRINITY_DN4320_c0_g1_i1.p1  ORF type:complete len:606 (-),score=99.51 TRINITY_DN4320_c0_g1_i1:18-1586(-)
MEEGSPEENETNTTPETEEQAQGKKKTRRDSTIGVLIDKAPTDIETYLPFYRQNQKDLRVVSFLSRQMEKNNVAPNREILNIQQTAFGKLGESSLIYKNAVRLINLPETLSSDEYFNILLSFKAIDDKETFQDILKDMENKNVPYNMNIFSLLFDQYSANPIDIISTQKLREKMDKSGLTPSDHVLNSLLRIYFRSHMFSEIHEIWEQMKNPEVSITLESYSYLMRVLKNNRKDLEGLKKRCEPNLKHGTPVTLDTILRSACQNKDESTIHKVLREMDLNNYRQSPEALMELIVYFSRGNQLDKSEHYYKLLKKQGHFPSVGVYNSLLISYMRREHDLSKAEEHLEEMKMNKIAPNEETLLILFDWYRKKKTQPDYDNLLLLAAQNKVPLSSVGTRIVRNYLEHNNQESLIKTLNLMQSLNALPNDATIRDLIKYFSRLGNIVWIRKATVMANTRGLSFSEAQDAISEKLRSYVVNRDLSSVVQFRDLKRISKSNLSPAAFFFRRARRVPLPHDKKQPNPEN